MIELTLIERKAEQATAQAGCCEPDCGPETCAPAATREERAEGAVAQASCCEPDCGPETCTCG